MRRTVALLGALAAGTALVAPAARRRGPRRAPVRAADETEVFEALDEGDDAAAAPVAAADATPDKDDETQQTRVLTYMGISILPLLALVPFLGSRDFLPADPSLYS